MALQISTREIELRSVTFPGDAVYPELHPEYDYGSLTPCTVKVFVADDMDPTHDNSACYVALDGKFYTPRQLQDIIDEATDFHNRLKK